MIRICDFHKVKDKYVSIVILSFKYKSEYNVNFVFFFLLITVVLLDLSSGCTRLHSKYKLL